jgi:hypothetical protein
VSHRLDQYVPARAWFDRQFAPEFAGTHGIGHITRVLVWSAIIAERFSGAIRQEELFWAAGLHDIKRWDDGIDPEHGERAADWTLTEFPVIRPDIAETVDLQLVAELIRAHMRNDLEIVDWSDELRILKDADGLDRVRIYDLDPRRLRLKDISPALEPKAWSLMEESVRRGNTADAVRSVAIEQGWWR